MRVALDTNRYTDFCRGDAETVETLETATAVFLPFVVVGELREMRKLQGIAAAERTEPGPTGGAE